MTAPQSSLLTLPQPTRSESRLDLLILKYGAEAVLGMFDEDEWNKVLFDWEGFNSREGQTLPPGDWFTWVIRSGRGWGKTRVGAEAIRGWAEAGEKHPMYIVGATSDDVRSTMIEGVSGILAVSPWWFRPEYEPSKRRLTWPNGAVAYTRSADRPDRFRGPQGSKAWLDEFCAWRYPQEAWDQINMIMRLGHPQMVMTTTPRPIKLFREICREKDTVVTTGTTRDNKRNLSEKFMERVYRKYEGTRLGRQELGGELLEDNPGALWKLSQIDDTRVVKAPALVRVVTAVDPAVTSDEKSAETGIIIAGVAQCSCKGTGKSELHAFVTDDRSDIYTPDEWAKAVAKSYHDHDADRVVAEVNNGGDLVESNLRTLGDSKISYRAVHASRGKEIRAEPIAAFYEQGKVHHVGAFAQLEDQMTQWNPLVDKKSPDRLDALVWALTDLMLGPTAPEFKGRTASVPRRY